MGSRWARGSCVCRQTWASCVSADWWVHRSTYSPRTSRAPRGTSIGIADSIFTLMSMPIELSMLTFVLLVRFRTLISRQSSSSISPTFQVALRRMSVSFSSSGDPECVQCGLECVTGAWVAFALRRNASASSERFLLQCDERINRSERYDRVVAYTSNYSLFVANKGTRFDVYGLFNFKYFVTIIFQIFLNISSNVLVRTTPLQKSLIWVPPTNLSDLKSNQQISLHHPSSRLH